jgi:superoxide reductase
MVKFGERLQTADWKSEKHVPVIECPNQVKKEELFDIKVSLGKEVAHPNKTEHHIRWITLYFHPDGDKFTYQVGHFEFNAHGESAQGPDTGPVYANHMIATSCKVGTGGTFHALAFCNIHGLWESTKAIEAG